MSADEGPWAARLAERPGTFDFHVALWRLEIENASRPRLGHGEHPSDEPIRLGQLPLAAFEGAELHGYTRGPEGKPPRLTVGFLGLWGPHGPLPSHLTEYAHDRITHAGDATLVRFADVFHHRILLLFYRAWAVSRPTTAIGSQASNPFSRYVGALMGTALPAATGRDGSSFGHLFHAPWFTVPRSAEGLRHILRDYLGVGVDVEEWVGQWLDLPDDERWRIGGPARTSALGHAVLGRRVWSRTTKFRIRLGPLDADEFERMLDVSDASPAFAALASIVRLYTNDEWEWDVRLALAPTEAPPFRLGTQGRLGWTSRLGAARSAGVDVVVDPRTGSTRRVRGSADAVQSN